MADFGTILNPDNTSLDLYCHSIRTEPLPPLETPSYFYGTAGGIPLTLGTQYVTFNTQFSNNVNNNPTGVLTGFLPGLYNVNITLNYNCNANSSMRLQLELSGTSPAPGTQATNMNTAAGVLMPITLQALVRINTRVDFLRATLLNNGNGAYTITFSVTYVAP